MSHFDDSLSPSISSDSETLALLGKKQVLKRRFGFWSLTAFAAAELITWETVLALFSQGFNNGGPAGLIWGFLIAWSSTLSVYTVISELASIAPIAAGQYYWVYMLAPQRWKIFCSYIVGWLNVLAWIATVATETIFAGTMLQGIVTLANPSYTPEPYQGTLFAYAVVIVAVMINVFLPDALPKFEIFIIIFHIAGFIAIVATLWATTPVKNTAEFVFTSSLNEGGWPTQGLSDLVGGLGAIATFVGADASVHLAEEVSNAARNIPRAIVTSMVINGVVGFIMMLTLLFCLGDEETVLETDLTFPFIQIFSDSVRNIAGAAFMSVIVLCLTWACATGIITTASRMTWSFARDNGLPFSKFLSKVSSERRIPVAALCAACGIGCILNLIYVGSPTAFNDVVSLTITGFYSTYLVPGSMLLYHRIRGNLVPYNSRIAVAVREEKKKPENEADSPSPPIQPDRRPSIVAQAQLVWGPFKLPGIIGIINNTYACAYMIFVIFWSVWPPETPVNYTTMNYSVVVTGGVIIFSVIWYFVSARKTYHGPLVDNEVEEVMRQGSVIQI